MKEQEQPPVADSPAVSTTATRRAETEAHGRLKRLGLFWAQQQGFTACAFEVVLPNCRYRADLAAYKPAKARLDLPGVGRSAICPVLGTTAVFECKQSRADFLKDSRTMQATEAELILLQARRTELERALRVHYPTLRVNDSLFQEYESHDFAGLEHATHHRVITRIARLQKRLYEGTKFDTLRRYRCGNVCYVIAEEGIFRPHEVPVGWGLLVRVDDRLDLRARPVWQELDDPRRLALLHRIATAGTRGINREAGITIEKLQEARRAGW